ncbi:hypothetical protein [Streptomyces flavofungini]|uniref:Uncharacterized protein n=1 Tax=Streptomyces flavofungini TaxID=68200 RepID=A0ABS0XIN2_9ACTN|nr:hypothetical protein [Streptomyces flavofungini]MBJ3813075.1 hypothetical protein [Streptomyces flavofungini]GHC89263.1 hypothetical protein GCM10010349_77050 [Streptomyces flavofungini]
MLEDGYRGAPPPGGADIKRGLEALKKFRRRIDTLLTEFEGSDGGSSKVGHQKVARASFSGQAAPFPEADGLYAQYDRVHERLTSLSKMLGQQIEGMGIAVHGADVGFDNLEDDLRQRFWSIQTSVQRDQVPTGRERDGKPDEQGGHGSDKSDSGWKL